MYYTVHYHNEVPFRIPQILKLIITSSGEDAKQMEGSYILMEMQNSIVIGENSLAVSDKVKNTLEHMSLS